MNLMKKNDMVMDLPKLVQPSEVCKGCLMAKQIMTLFPSQSNYVSSKVLDLVHGDICGPISPPTPSGKRYFLLLVDDFSCVMWAYFLSTKDDAFKIFKALVENGSEKGLKLCIQTEVVNFALHNLQAIMRMLEFLDITPPLILHNKMGW